MGANWIFKLQKIDKSQKVSAQISLRGMRRLIWADTFSKCIKIPFNSTWHIFIFQALNNFC